MPDVADRLERLAAHAPAGGVDPDLLWRQGRRRQGRRWAAVAATVAAVGLLGASLVPGLVDRSRGIDPARSDATVVLPGTLRQPGGLDGVLPDPPGRLSAIGLGQAFSLRTLSRTSPWWAVSATTGESGFLDLPDLTDLVDAPALSADGRRLAYWVTGEVGGTPIVNGTDTMDGAPVAPVVGVAVLDLDSGDRRVWEVDSEHGLFTGGMAWAGDVLRWWAGPTREVNGTFGGEAVPHAWDLRTGARTSFDESAGPPVGWTGLGEAPGGFLTMDGPRRIRWDTADGATSIRIVVPGGTPDEAPSQAEISQDGSRLAVLVPPGGDAYDDLHPLLVGEVVDGVARLAPVADVETRDIAGWRSPTEVVVIEDAGLREGREPQALTAWTVDVVTGERTRLIDFDVQNTPVVAAGAWAAEVVEAPDAPVAPDHWLFGAAASVLSLLLLASWGRSRSRRGHP